MLKAGKRALNTNNMAQDTDQKQQWPQPQKEKESTTTTSVSTTATTTSSSPCSPAGADDISISSSSIKDDNNHDQKKGLIMKQKRDKVVSFRLSEQEYARCLSTARTCHETGLANKPDIVAFIRVSMECLWQYIIYQKQEPSAAIEQQKKVEGEGSEKQIQHQSMITINAATAADEFGGVRREFSYLEQYFQPVFEELNKLNKTLDSIVEKENDETREKKK
jgi:hypothetical protein